jgi:hypothetical protein
VGTNMAIPPSMVLKSTYNLPPEQLNSGGTQASTGVSFMNYDILLFCSCLIIDIFALSFQIIYERSNDEGVASI